MRSGGQMKSKEEYLIRIGTLAAEKLGVGPDEKRLATIHQKIRQIVIAKTLLNSSKTVSSLSTYIY